MVESIRYKLVALDLDGTLLNSQGQLSTKHIEAVRKARNAGVQVLIATGRYFMQTLRIIEELNYDGILVLNDGALIIDTKDNKVIYENSFSMHDVEQLVNVCRERNIHFAACTAFDYFVEVIDDAHLKHYGKYGIRYTIHENLLSIKDGIMKFLVSAPSKIENWSHCELKNNIGIKTDAPHFKEYAHIKATKKEALAKVLELMNYNPSEVIAVGDFYNDLDMIEYAGLGIAMGNAPNDVKKKANDVTLSNDEDGVYHALEKYLFQ